ncbi:60 kDa lysophospholipase [Seminavis robusta]|uniref:asparaginase n=1 Tax=Seminavis robusta TaxID=568900 RepID=A0A9N8H1D4_9STRA|nr:60 kDa lysophospholipase [Seminavis robusta]|eukprot:Sro15_g011100.1 60 kDa lysophospholipase (538) ;mRNA; f:70901-72760
MKLGIVYTGGTIGCFYRPLRPMTSEEFAALFDQHAMPIIAAKYPQLRMQHIPFGSALDSTNIQPMDWCKIVETILSAYMTCDCFLVLHGTDTMAYTASALSFLFTGVDTNGHRDCIINKPIIVTGSQLPLFDGENPKAGAQIRFNSDAFQNICGAVTCAHYGIPKVCLFFNNKLFLGTRAQKTSSNQFDAFSSPNYPPLAQVGIEATLNHGSVKLHFPSKEKLLTNPLARERLQAQLDYISSLGNEKIRVSTFEAYPANSKHLAGQLRNILHLDNPEKQLHGLILEAYGAGNFPSGNPAEPTKGEVYQVLAEATAKGVIIVNNTRCLSGIVDSSAYEAGSWMASVRAVSAYDLTPVALYTKLLFMLSLAHRYNWSGDTIRTLLAGNYAGEMLDVHCLDTFGQRELWPGESITSLDGTARLTNDWYRGPILRLRQNGNWSEPVWSAMDSSRDVGLTCILRMQSDGNLVFRNHTLECLWESGTAKDAREEPYSRLELTGLTHPEGASLQIYNYVSHVVTKRLFPVEDDTGTGAKRVSRD